MDKNTNGAVVGVEKEVGFTEDGVDQSGNNPSNRVTEFIICL